MAQVSGNKINNVTASKNLGTVINNQVDGNKIDAQLQYRKITNVENTQLFGAQKLTNYMGINDEGMDIFHAKKITGHELNVDVNPTVYTFKANNIWEANNKIKEQEADKKKKAQNTPEGPFVLTVESAGCTVRVMKDGVELPSGSELNVGDLITVFATADVPEHQNSLSLEINGDSTMTLESMYTVKGNVHVKVWDPIKMEVTEPDDFTEEPDL